MTADMKNTHNMTTFGFACGEITRRKHVQLLCRSDLVVAAVQSIGEGGETNLHSHDHLDGFWFVLSGRARFYASRDEIVAELGPGEGILIPRGTPYWFEGVGDERLDILQVEASDRQLRSLDDVISDRVNLAAPAPDLADMTANLHTDDEDLTG